MKIYTRVPDEAAHLLSQISVSECRWTQNAADIVGAKIASAVVQDEQVDLIRSRQAREDGDWSKEVCLFPDAVISDLQLL